MSVCWLIQCPRNIWRIFSSSGREVYCFMVSASPTQSNLLTFMRWESSKSLSPFLELGIKWMFRNPTRRSLSVVCSLSIFPKWVHFYLVSYLKLFIIILFPYWTRVLESTGIFSIWGHFSVKCYSSESLVKPV